MLSALVLAAAIAAAPSDKPKLIVLDLTPAGGLDPAIAGAFTETLAGEVSATGIFDAVASRDFKTLMGLERQKQLVGCSEQASTCLTELAGALGARFVMSGSLAKLGEAYQLTLQTLDSQKAAPVGRSTRIARSLDELQRQLALSVSEATGTPPPEPPSLLLPISLMVAGGLAIGMGGISGFNTLSEESALARELERGQQLRVVLKPLSEYQQDAARLAQQKTISATVLGGGVLLAGAGAFLALTASPSSRRGGAPPKKLSLQMTPQGVLVAGDF